MIFCIFFSFLAAFGACAQPPISFDTEKEKIMSKYIELNIKENLDTSYLAMLSGTSLPVQGMLEIDPKVFFQQMQNLNNDYLFLIIFWKVFDSNRFFFCPPSNAPNSKDFIDEIIKRNWLSMIIADIIYHFKVYLMRKLFFYSDPGDRQELLSRAMHFFNSSLKNLIQKLKGRNEPLFKAMPQNFHFYQKCIRKETLESVLLNELFHLNKAKSLDNQTQIATHTENLTFLVGALNYAKSSLFSFSLISNQSPQYVGYFMQVRKCYPYLLRDDDIDPISEVNFNWNRFQMLKDLFHEFPIFEIPKEINASTKFKLTNEFKNSLNEINNKDELAKQAEINDLTKTIFDKILHL
jgi:hypothetical protein